jgi:thioredoxin reductase (NADPH)
MSPDDVEAELAPAETRDSHEAFPRLTTDQLEVLQACGQRRTAEVGDVVYRAGEDVSKLLVVLSGSVGIVDSDPGGDRVVEVQRQGEILGELGMLEGQPALLSARVVQDAEILAVPTAHLSEVALQDSVLGETILRPF